MFSVRAQPYYADTKDYVSGVRSYEFYSDFASLANLFCNFADVTARKLLLE